jgi:predicted ABC-type ATPase
MPKAVIIAGPNGAGKTTFARNLLPLDHPDCAFLNADEIRRESGVFASDVSAGRELIRRLEGCLGAVQSFAVETTLSSRTYARRIPDWRRKGFEVWLHFLDVATPDLAVARVAQRVAAGGHGVPEADIRRRYARSAVLYPIYRNLADAWYYFRVDQKGSQLVAYKDP